ANAVRPRAKITSIWPLSEVASFRRIIARVLYSMGNRQRCLRHKRNRPLAYERTRNRQEAVTRANRHGDIGHWTEGRVRGSTAVRSNRASEPPAHRDLQS